MKYVYTFTRNNIKCSECEKRIQELKSKNIQYIEVDGNNILNIDRWDKVGLEAMAQFYLQDQVFPVEVSIDG